MVNTLPSLKDILSNGTSSAKSDEDMERTPLETEKAPSKDMHTDPGVMMKMMKDLAESKEDGVITNEDGYHAAEDQTNPFLKALQTSRANNNTGPGVLKQLLGSLTNPTDVGSAISTGPITTQQATDPTPTAQQSQPGLQQTPGAVPLPQPRPLEAPQSPYAQPTALDPVSIEQLRQSLMTGAGQLDPNNANGLSGRMNSPNAVPDMGQQRNQSQQIEDRIMGFDGSPKPGQRSDVTDSPFQVAGDYMGQVQPDSGTFTGAQPFQGDPTEWMKTHTGPNIEGYKDGEGQMLTRPKPEEPATS